MNKTTAVATYALSAGLLAVAGALAYFTFELSRIHRDLPAILEQVEHTSGKVDPILVEMMEIRRLVPPILTEVAAVREEMPSILNEIESTRTLVPSIVEEVEETRRLIPSILKEVEASRAAIPDILKAVDAAASSLDRTNREVEAIRQQIPDVLQRVEAIRQEIEATRTSLPATLDRVDELVAKAGAAGQKATEGAVTGVFTGVITAPFRALVGLGQVVGGDGIILEGEDLKIATDAAIALAASEKGSEKAWNNPGSGRHGRFALLDKYRSSDKECVTMKHQFWEGEKLIVDRVFNACHKDGASTWELKK